MIKDCPIRDGKLVCVDCKHCVTGYRNIYGEVTRMGDLKCLECGSANVIIEPFLESGVLRENDHMKG